MRSMTRPRAFYVHHRFLPLPDSPYRLFWRTTTSRRCSNERQNELAPAERVEEGAATRQKSYQGFVIASRDGGGSEGAIDQPNLAERIRRHFAPFGGVDHKLSPLEVADEPPSFDPEWPTDSAVIA
jgi:hypothetical protein